MLKIPKNFDSDKQRKRLADSRILAPYLERELERFEEPWTFKYSPKGSDDAWHPSSDCLPPPTVLYAKAKGLLAPEVRSASSTKNFQVGHFWHALIQHIVLNKLGFCSPDAIERVGTDIWQYEYGEDERTHPMAYHWVRGAGDIAPLIAPKWAGIVDVKTMKQEDFALPTLPPQFEAKYLAQINCYMHLFDAEQAMILAVNKNGPHAFKEITYVRDQALIDKILNKWHFVADCLERDVAPTPEDDLEYQL